MRRMSAGRTWPGSGQRTNTATAPSRPCILHVDYIDAPRIFKKKLLPFLRRRNDNSSDGAGAGESHRDLAVVDDHGDDPAALGVAQELLHPLRVGLHVDVLRRDIAPLVIVPRRLRVAASVLAV